MECSSRAGIRSLCSDLCSIDFLLKRKHFRSKNYLARTRNCYPKCSGSTYHLARCRHHHSSSNLVRREIDRYSCLCTLCLILWNMLYLLSRGTCTQLLPTRSTCFLRHKGNRCQGRFGSTFHPSRRTHHRSNQ